MRSGPAAKADVMLPYFPMAGSRSAFASCKIETVWSYPPVDRAHSVVTRPCAASFTTEQRQTRICIDGVAIQCFHALGEAQYSMGYAHCPKNAAANIRDCIVEVTQQRRQPLIQEDKAGQTRPVCDVSIDTQVLLLNRRYAQKTSHLRRI